MSALNGCDTNQEACFMVYMWFAIVPRHNLATGNFQPNKPLY